MIKAMPSFNISFAGAGRVAGALSRKMHQSGSRIMQIVSRDEKNGRILAGSCEATWSDELTFPASSEIIIVAVPDHSLKHVLNKIKCGEDTIVAHTAGSLGLDIFPGHILRKGIFYPLQTFSKNREIDFSNLPFFIEASDGTVSEKLNNLAESTGGIVHFADSDHRKALHLAAVFICNFTNHMLAAGQDIAERSGFGFDVFKSLINETIAKAIEEGPEKSQTGPAVRNDLNIIEKHLDLLSFSPEYRNVYREVTKSIQEFYKKSDK